MLREELRLCCEERKAALILSSVDDDVLGTLDTGQWLDLCIVVIMTFVWCFGEAFMHLSLLES